MYERAVVSQSPEEAERLFAALVKEEAKLKEVELEARKVAALEQQVKLQALRIEVDMAKAKERGLKKAEVVESTPAAAELPNGNAEPEDYKQRLGEILGILNRGGSPEERILQARDVLSNALKSIHATS
jgi:hypothetical protein